MAHFVPCKKCGSSRTPACRVYEDGHMFCFSCRTYWPAPMSITNIKNKMNDNYKLDVATLDIDTSNFTHVIPPLPRQWLNKYGITDAEINHFQIYWNPQTHSLGFPVFDSGTLVFTNERYFGPDPNQPKYKAHGPKDRYFRVVGNKNTPESCILVEDMVSAIKVGRFATCLPLWGVNLPDKALKWLSGRFKHVRVWLDMNKASTAIGMAAKLSQVIPDVRTIITELDPKEYTNTQLINLLKQYKVLGG